MKRISLKDIGEQVTPEELAELKAAEERPIIFDEESPEMTPEMLLQFKRDNRANRVKKTVSLRLSPQTLQKAKSYGQGYTAFLSRLIELAINDKNLVKQCL